MRQKTHEFLQLMHELQKDNSRLEHLARRSPEAKIFSTMPVTSFVYQFFLYNSVYQVDWEVSTRQGQVSSHRSSMYETMQQDKLEDFLRRKDPSAQVLLSCFQPMMDVVLSGPWTEIVQDDTIKLRDGRAFFENLREIQGTVHRGRADSPDELYSQVKKCRHFIYKVRNNIFHGRKTLDEIYDKQQKRRIEVYYLFLNCLMEWFFTVASD